MSKKGIIRFLAIIVALMMPMIMMLTCFAEEDTAAADTQKSQSYLSPDINELTGHGEEPEELSVSSAAKYQEKAWYEYVMYSDHAVCSYRVNDDYRLLFYDPYTYTNSMVMDVQFDANTTEFDTMSEYSISHTNSKTIDACVSSTNTYTSAEQTSGRDVTHTDVQNGGEQKTTYNHEVDTVTNGTIKNETDYEYIRQDYDTSSSDTLLTTASEIGGQDVFKEVITVGGTDTVNHNTEWLLDKTTDKTIYSDGYKTTTTYSGDSTLEDNTTSATDGWTELSARITKTLCSSNSTSNSWSETESTTVTKIYAATHFASDGITPLPWAIVHYGVQMPMKCCLQVKYSGEWVTISTVYCLLTTVQGTCRAWMQNGQVYYEDWGSGEPVVETEFWSQFMTKESLIKAYSDKLYPEGEN